MESLRRFASLAEVRAFSHPLRLEIVRRLEIGPKTVAQIARDMEVRPSKLYYHVGELAKIEAVRVAETRQVGNLIERYYELTAKDFRFDREAIIGLGEDGRVAFGEAVRAVLQATGQAYRDADRDGMIGEPQLRALRATLFTVRLDEARLSRLQERLQEIMDELDAEPRLGPITAKLGLVYFPLV